MCVRIVARLAMCNEVAADWYWRCGMQVFQRRKCFYIIDWGWAGLGGDVSAICMLYRGSNCLHGRIMRRGRPTINSYQSSAISEVVTRCSTSLIQVRSAVSSSCADVLFALPQAQESKRSRTH